MLISPASQFDVRNHAAISSSVTFVCNLRSQNVLFTELQIISVGSVDPVSRRLSFCLYLSFYFIYLFLSMQGRIYSCGGPGAIKMCKLLSVTINLGYIAIAYK
jgi:hypothetical protein